MKMITTTKSNLCFFGELEKKKKENKMAATSSPPPSPRTKKTEIRKKRPTKNSEKKHWKNKGKISNSWQSTHLRLSFRSVEFRNWFYWVLLGFEPVLSSFTEFCWTRVGFTGLNRVRTGFTGFYRVLLGFHCLKMGSTRFYLVLPGFPGWQMGFTEFYRVLPGFL